MTALCQSVWISAYFISNDMSADLLTLVVNVIATPLLVVLTMWVRSQISSKERDQKREDGFIDELIKRVGQLETDIKEVRAELKNRDAEYLALYQQHTTMKAKYEVLSAEYEQLRKDYNSTASELNALKEDIKTKAAAAAKDMQKI
jgi:chromosome segregation ATPase